MIIAIEDLRKRAGITAGDSSQDADLNMVEAQALALMENYCNRKFDYAAEVEEFVHVSGHMASLQRYPVETIDKMSNSAVNYHVDKVAGVLHFDAFMLEHVLKVDYTAGYKVFPPDLLLVLASMFDLLWSKYNSAGAASAQAGAISQVTLQGVGSVKFNTGAAVATGVGAGGMITPDNIAILSNYKRWNA